LKKNGCVIYLNTSFTKHDKHQTQPMQYSKMPSVIPV
jgi:hypothetical protein